MIRLQSSGLVRYSSEDYPMTVFEGRARRGLFSLVLSCMVLFVVFGSYLATPQPAYAQAAEDKKDETTTTTEEKEQPNLLEHIISSAGWFFGPLLLLISIGLVTLIVLLAMDLRMGVSVPGAFVDEFTDLVNKRQFRQAFDLCREDGSFLGRVLTAGMGRLQYGIEDARRTSLEMVESIKAGKDQLINYLGTIGTLGPMIGLVGTVYGMILAFMALSAGGKPDPQKLAGAISHALVVTLLGIALSVPAIFCYTFFKNRLTRLSMDTSNLADDLLTQMYHNSKKAAPAVPTAAPARAAAVQTAGIKPAE
jgi:biopolymer transport protein ExbB